MKNIVLIFWLSSLISTVQSQSITRSVISTAGGHYSGTNLDVGYTFGETFTQTFGMSNLVATQGFHQTDTLIPTTLNIICFIQGYYMWNGQMSTSLFNQGVSSDLSVTDTLELEIINPVNPYNILQSTLGILHTNGSFTCKLNPSLFGHAYYLVLKHRNAIETWSSSPILINGITNYNFSTSASQAYGDNQKDVSGNGTVFALYSGDVTKDENIDLFDLTWIEIDISNFSYGYFYTDINGDGNVDLYDFLIPEENVSNFVYSLYP